MRVTRRPRQHDVLVDFCFPDRMQAWEHQPDWSKICQEEQTAVLRDTRVTTRHASAGTHPQARQP